MKARLYFSFLLFFIFHNCCADSKIFVVSIPKSGTNLIIKTLKLLTGKKDIWSPNFYDLDFVQDAIFSAHCFYSKDIIEILRKEKFKVFFIYRDPRDQAISWLYYMCKTRPQRYNLQNSSQILTSYILGMDSHPNRNLTLLYSLMMPWAGEPFVYTTTFERLVGPHGGGDVDVQLQEIINIGKHLGLTLDKEDGCEVAQRLFGGTRTFRLGKIGSWRNEFNTEHKQACKDHAGQLLIDLGYEKDLHW